MTDSKTILITGSAKRLGAIAEHLHSLGHRVIIHYRHSKTEATALAKRLNEARADSALVVQADLSNPDSPQKLVKAALAWTGQLDMLINNASDFYQTPFAEATQTDWDQLFASNVRGPYFLTQAALPELAKQAGCVIHITDAHLDAPYDDCSIYYMAKNALAMMQLSLAKDFKATKVEQHIIAPGRILPPEKAYSDQAMKIAHACAALI